MSTPGPDCATCIQKNTCERAKEGTFCPEYRSEPLPEYEETEDPNYLWQHGEDVEF